MQVDHYSHYFSAFQLEDRLIFSCCVKTIEGQWYLHQPIVVLDVQSSHFHIGQTVLETLARSEQGWLEPPDAVTLAGTSARLFESARVQTFEQLLERVLHGCVGRAADIIEMTPTHIGSGHAVDFLVDARLRLKANMPAAQTGEALQNLFAACTSIYR